MSGIFGYYSLSSDLNDKKISSLKKWNITYGTTEMCKQIQNNTYFGVSLEHFSNRTPTQKDFLYSDDYIAVIDALLYNRDELAEKFGKNLIYLSDEEMLFEIIKKHGNDALSFVNGDFAGVIYDKTSETFTMFRDHIGVRPLFFYLDNQTFIFSTDMRGILAIPDLNIEIDDQNFYRMVSGMMPLHTTATEYKQIQYLKNASVYTIKKDNNELKLSALVSYWKLGSKKIKMSNDQAYINEMRRLVENAVNRRKAAVDGIIGAELSGGLDSSVICRLLRQNNRECLFFSWSQDPSIKPIIKENDERRIISEICKLENTSCGFKKYDPAITPSSFEDYKKLFYPPYENTLDMSYASKWFSSKDVKAVMSGFGGDEGISHRCTTNELFYNKEYLAVLKTAYRQSKGKNLRILRTVKRFYSLYKRFRAQLTEEYYNYSNIKDLLCPDFSKRMDTTMEDIPFLFFMDPAEHVKQGGVRPRLDNAAFQAANYHVRYMFPYLDYEVLDFAVSIPRRLYFEGRGDRWIYMQAFKDLIPDYLEKYRSKRSPSRANEMPPTEEERELIELQYTEAFKCLDAELWKNYLDLQKLEHFKLPEKITREEYHMAFSSGSLMLYCVQIENLLLNLSK